jgi:PPOX class probable F420-dependent enzyme
MVATGTEEFLRTHSQAVLATIRRDSRPQLSNILYAYDGGKILISTTESRAKYHNIRRDPRVSLLVLGDNFWQYLTVDGTVTIVAMPEALPRLRAYYELAAGKPHPNWEEYDESMRAERRVLLEVAITNATGYNI